MSSEREPGSMIVVAEPYRFRDSTSGLVLSIMTLFLWLRAFSHALTHFCHDPSESCGKHTT